MCINPLSNFIIPAKGYPEDGPETTCAFEGCDFCKICLLNLLPDSSLQLTPNFIAFQRPVNPVNNSGITVSSVILLGIAS